MTITLDEFRGLPTQEQVKLVNSFADGEKNLKDIESNFSFTNLSKYINRAEAYWDGSLKKFILIKQSNLTIEEINFVKQNYKRHIESKALELNKANIMTRSIRVDRDVIKAFIRYCKANNIQQTNAFTMALKNYMDI